ncbi:hypothetical protein CLIB1423_05S04434 [[Candida] railenensis]|uniref:Uncharacterized protein n=1 Tax=[Candida] railenensis TaxID=45579 RepID=A0A9P0QML5_9ASCO|nr:hypothetical protein CLIB1423_05S04434 [[Candida] railenensis]
MKLFLTTSLLLSTLVSCQWYPQDQKSEIPIEFQGYETGQEIYLECIQRNIDNGEHKFDEKDRIIYAPFPKCKETGSALALKYGVSEDINCTIAFTDELYHLFQLYIHEDAPFSCRIPISGEKDYIRRGGAFIPLTFNFRGEIHDSHLDIDDSINLVAIGAPINDKEGTVVSAIAWSSGTNATRIVIGDYLTLNLGIRWLSGVSPYGGSSKEALKNAALPFADGFYKLPKSFMSFSTEQWYISMLFAGLTGAVVMYLFTYFTKTNRAKQHKWVDPEVGFTKND